MKPTLSLCMIVKDEEASLGRCLKSVQPFVDEIIVVDTGSTDRTVEIAKGFGAHVFHHPWENDFAKHRNQSISYATGDWILRLDADEELFCEDGTLLRKTIREGKADYYFCEMHDMKKDGSERGVFYQLRLFRNGMGMRFERPVHEQLLVKGKGDYVRIRIRHYGYDLSPEKMEEKHRARLAALEEILKRDPDDLYSRNQLASCHSMHRDFSEAIRQGEIVLEARRRQNLKHPFFLTTFYTVGQGYLALGKVEKGEKVFREALDFFPHHLDACYFLSLIYYNRRDWENCQTFAERYLEIQSEMERNPTTVGSYYCHHLDKKTEVLFWLGSSLFFQNEEKKAAAIFEEAYRSAGEKPEAAMSIARLYAEGKKEEGALSWLARAWENAREGGTMPDFLRKDNRLFLSLGLFYARENRVEEAVECLLNAQDENLSPSQLLDKKITLARLLWQKGELEGFVSQLSALIAISGAQTLSLIDKIEDIGTILYDITQALEEKGNWQAALVTLKLALEIYPPGFERRRFDSLLKNASLRTGHPYCS
ncbi:MAG TPA: glycosyltransferase [Syntrophales bacterium]|nr:glycosyltransferase [Syntrophales bacterium]